MISCNFGIASLAPEPILPKALAASILALAFFNAPIKAGTAGFASAPISPNDCAAFPMRSPAGSTLRPPFFSSLPLVLESAAFDGAIKFIKGSTPFEPMLPKLPIAASTNFVSPSLIIAARIGTAIFGSAFAAPSALIKKRFTNTSFSLFNAAIISGVATLASSLSSKSFCAALRRSSLSGFFSCLTRSKASSARIAPVNNKKNAKENARMIYLLLLINLFIRH